MNLPKRPLTDQDLYKYAKKLPHFRGIFMRDSLPKKINKNECGIVNLDDESGAGTHWVAYCKRDTECTYFDSFGNLKPPLEIINYLPNSITYNYERYQNYDTFNCGHLCLKFLYNYCNKY